MPLVISDPNTIAAIERLAAQSGKTEEQVLSDLVADRGQILHDEPSPRPDWQDRLEFIRRIGQRAAAKVPESRRFDNHADLLYDEHGLPN